MRFLLQLSRIEKRTARRAGSRTAWRSASAAWISGTTGSWRRSGISTSPIASRPRQIGLIIGWSGVGGGIGQADRRIGAEMPRQLERQLHAGREFRKALVDAELEDRTRGPDGAARSPAATGVSPARSVMISHWPVAASATAARRMKAASPSSCISAVPRWAFQPLASSVKERLERGARRRAGVRATSKCTVAMLGQPVALAAQLLQFLGAQRFAQQFVGIAGGIEAGAQHAIAAGAGAGRRGAMPRVKASWRRRRARRRAGSAHGRRRRAPGCISRAPRPHRHARDRAAACTACHRDRR